MDGMHTLVFVVNMQMHAYRILILLVNYPLLNTFLTN